MADPETLAAEVTRPRRTKDRFLFRYSYWDAIPAALVFIQLGLMLAFFIAWPQLSCPSRIGCACL